MRPAKQQLTKGEGPMSNYDYEDDDFDTPSNDADETISSKQLRKATKQKDKELAELKAQFESLNKAQP
jgi:hypothetical protein